MIFPLLLLAVSTLVQGQGIDFDVVYAKRPNLSKAHNSKTTAIRTTAVASSIVSRMNKQRASRTNAAPKTTRRQKITTRKAINNLTTKRKNATKKPINEKHASNQKKTLANKKTQKTTSIKKTANKNARPKQHRKRATNACRPQHVSYKYRPSPNNPTGFLVDSKLAGIAKSTAYPAGYSATFSNHYASVNGKGSLGILDLSTYDPARCAALCDSVRACRAFNIYFERSPTLDPGPKCPNPTAYTAVRCALWNSHISQSRTTDIGSWRSNFMTVIQGSNGYNKVALPPTIKHFNKAVALNGAIDARRAFISAKLLTGTQRLKACADLCTQTTAANKKAASAGGSTSYTACNYFNTAELMLDSTLHGTYCQLYSDDVTNNDGLYSAVSKGVKYTLAQSFGYALSNYDPGALEEPVLEPTGTSQSFSTSISASTSVSASESLGQSLTVRVSTSTSTSTSESVGQSAPALSSAISPSPTSANQITSVIEEPSDIGTNPTDADKPFTSDTIPQSSQNPVETTSSSSSEAISTTESTVSDSTSASSSAGEVPTTRNLGDSATTITPILDTSTSVAADLEPTALSSTEALTTTSTSTEPSTSASSSTEPFDTTSSSTESSTTTAESQSMSITTPNELEASVTSQSSPDTSVVTSSSSAAITTTFESSDTLVTSSSSIVTSAETSSSSAAVTTTSESSDTFVTTSRSIVTLAETSSSSTEIASTSESSATVVTTSSSIFTLAETSSSSTEIFSTSESSATAVTTSSSIVTLAETSSSSAAISPTSVSSATVVTTSSSLSTSVTISDSPIAAGTSTSSASTIVATSSSTSDTAVASPPPVAIAALGSSYASGPGLNTPYGQTFANKLAADRNTSAVYYPFAVAGSYLADIGKTQAANLQGLNLSAVVLTSGGNDLQYYNCLVNPNDTACNTTIGQTTFNARLVGALNAIYDNLPAVSPPPVFVVTYPRPFGPATVCGVNTASCPLTAEQRKRSADTALNIASWSVTAVNDFKNSRAGTNSTTVVAMWALSANHEVGSAAPWVNGNTKPAAGGGTIWHPTQLGADSMGNAAWNIFYGRPGNG